MKKGETAWTAIVAWLGVAIGICGLALSVVQYQGSKREILTLDLQRADGDFLSEVGQPTSSRGRSARSIELIWEATISNNSDVPVSLTSYKIEVPAPAVERRIETSQGQPAEWPVNIAAHTSTRLSVRSALPARECVERAGRAFPDARPSFMFVSWGCYLAGEDPFGNDVSYLWGYVRFPQSEVHLNPALSLKVFTSRGTEVGTQAEWYDRFNPVPWAAQRRPSSEVLGALQDVDR